MIRFSWRQFRMQAAVALGVLVAIAVAFAATRPHLAHLYDVYAKAQAACLTSRNCSSQSIGVGVDVGTLDGLLGLVGTALVGVPALLAAFWGAPLVAREFEAGTHRLAWTQSVMRTRWLAAKLTVVGAASVIATGLLSLLVTWWSSPMDTARAHRFGAGMFGERNIAPLGYAAFGFALGVVAGALIRRTLPAMATTIVGLLAVRLAFTYGVRPNIFSPLHKTLSLDPNSMGFGTSNGQPATLMPNPPNLPNAWIYSTHIVDNAGHGLVSQTVAAACPNLPFPGQGPGSSVQIAAPGDVQSALQDCVTKLAHTYHEVVTYQPANRYWTLQWSETAIYFVAALAIAGFCFWWIRNRAR